MKRSTRKRPSQVQVDLQAVGKRIRELRGFYVSQAEFSDKIGVTQSYLSALERGLKEPGATVLLAISREVGKTVDWLLTGETPPSNKKRR